MGRKPKRIVLLLGLVAFSTVYTYAFRTLDSHFLWKSLAVLLPIQVGGSAYFLYLYWTGKILGTQPFKKIAADRPPTSPKT